MTRNALILWLALLFPFAAFGQTATSNSNASSTSGASASGYSTSGAGAQSNQGQSLIYAPTVNSPDEVRSTNRVEGSYTVRNVPNVYAPGLAIGTGSCMGSSSGGASGAGFGISIGTTWEDEDCQRRSDALLLFNMGFPQAGLARMCQHPDNADAIAASGMACPMPETQQSTAPIALAPAKIEDRTGTAMDRAAPVRSSLWSPVGQFPGDGGR